MPLSRRQLLASSAASLMLAASAHGTSPAPLRLVLPEPASPLLRAVAADLQRLLAPTWLLLLDGPLDSAVFTILAGPSGSVRAIDRRAAWRCETSQPGSFRISLPGEGARYAAVIAGSDDEGVRNGLYRFFEGLGLGLFRDGETTPRQLAGQPQEGEQRPAFPLRGEMLWSYYPGPRRFCPITWGAAHWERALVHAARAGHNLIEFYPPLSGLARQLWPDLADTPDPGPLWTAETHLELARAVLARGRALGLRFMYCLTYGQLPAELAAVHPELPFNEAGFLGAEHEALGQLTEALWGRLVEQLGSDGLFALRHRGEEGQSYSDPNAALSKAAGFQQGLELLQRIAPGADTTVWTWAEPPGLFRELPGPVIAAHIRHGMGGVMSDDPRGREQAVGRPPIPAGRRWWLVPFTTFGANEARLRTAFCDPWTIAREAREASGSAGAFLHWPEWTATNPWLHRVMARCAWDPQAFDPGAALWRYARARHGDLAGPWLGAFEPLLGLGNARVMGTPRKRMLVAWRLSPTERDGLDKLRQGCEALYQAASSTLDAPLLRSDLADLLREALWGQAEAQELAAFLAARGGDTELRDRWLRRARRSWEALLALLTAWPDLSLEQTAEAIAAEGPLSPVAEQELWRLGCDFYGGYPLVLGPEALELVVLPQHEELVIALGRDEVQLETPRWLWRDLPEGWHEACWVLPRENDLVFERRVRERLRAGLERGAARRSLDARSPHTGLAEGAVAPAAVQPPSRSALRDAVQALDVPLPDALDAPPTP